MPARHGTLRVALRVALRRSGYCSQIEKEYLKQAADGYKNELHSLGAKLVTETNAVSKGKLVFVFRAPRGFSQDSLYDATLRHLPPELRGELDWRVE